MGILQALKKKFTPTFEVTPGPIFSREPLFADSKNDKKGVKAMGKHKKFEGVVNANKVAVKPEVVVPVPAGIKPEVVVVKPEVDEPLPARKVAVIKAYNVPVVTPQKPLVGVRHNVRITPKTKLIR